MKRSNRLVILVGVLLAIVAFVLVVIMLNQAGPNPNGPDAEPTTATVLIAKSDIAIGDPVTPDKVEATEVPIAAAGSNALADPSLVGGQAAIVAVPAGSQVTSDVIGRAGGPVNISAQLLPGEKAIAVRLDPTTGVNFLIEPGDTIDLVVSAEIAVVQETADSVAARAQDPDLSPRFESVAGLEGGARSVKTVLQNKRVLYVSATNIPEQPDPNATPPPEGAVTAPVAIESVVVVFAGTDQDAEVLKFTQRDNSELSSERTDIAGSVTVVIRAENDDAVETTTGITIDQLVADYGLPVPGIVNLEELPETP